MTIETTAKTQETKELQEAIKKLIETKKINISTIARGVNKSASTISLYLSDNYNGRVDTLENDLKNYLKLFKKQENIEFKTLNFIETNVTKRLFNAANMCQMRGKMGVCYGIPGIGKTTAILEYKKISSGIIVVDPFEQTSAREVLKQIADQLKVNYHNNMSLDEFTNNVIKKLERNKYLIVLDEAENLKIDIFKIIRKIHDKTKNNCGILFVGTNELRCLLSKVQSGFPYIASRIGYVEKLDSLNIPDIEKLIIQYFPNCSKTLINSFAKACNYNARNIQNMLDLCLDIIQSNNIELNIDVIETAREKLLI